VPPGSRRAAGHLGRASAPADGTWRWKDEDDFAEAQRLGVFTPAETARVRAEGERVLAARPWPTGWEQWRPWQARPRPSGPG
jgi:hypothetical protein